MTHYDLFNGDADGIFALQQLRRAIPCDSVLISDVKREVTLLKRVEAHPGDRVTILDLSLASNRDDLERLLDQGAEVTYVDHHHAGEPLNHARLTRHIDTSPHICTSLLVDRLLEGRERAWALAGAYGDNLIAEADQLAQESGLSQAQRNLLRRLGTLVNYNGYGRTLADLHIEPVALYRQLLNYPTPWSIEADSASPLTLLQRGYDEDRACIEALVPVVDSPGGQVYQLPDAPWAHRISGVYANELANRHPNLAIAMLTPQKEAAWRVSVRAPLLHPFGADTLCLQFVTGGGRARAAGINILPDSQLDSFLSAFEQSYPG